MSKELNSKYDFKMVENGKYEFWLKEGFFEAGDKEKATALLNVAFSKIDKSVSRGIQHKNTAARQKAHLTSIIAAL